MASRNQRDLERAAAEANRAAQASEAGRVLRAQREDTQAAPAVESAPESEFEEAPKISRGNPVRDAAMAAIERRLDPATEEEPAADEPEPEEPKRRTKADKKQLHTAVTQEETVAYEQPESTEQAPAAETPAPEIKTVKAKVNGQEFDVPEAEIEEAGGLKAWQINRAAQQHLEEAKQAAAEVKRERAQLLAMMQQQLQPQQPKAQEMPEKEWLAAKAQQIRFGSDEESAAALSEVMSRNKVDSNAIISQATQQMQRSIAIEQFKSEFSDVLSSPILMRAAASMEQEYLSQSRGTPVDWGNLYRTIGNQIRTEIGRRPPQSAASAPIATADPSSPTDREARKASIVNLPTAAQRAQLPPGEPKPETREDILAEMRKARGKAY